MLEYTRRFDGIAADALPDLRVPARRLGRGMGCESGARERAALAEAGGAHSATTTGGNGQESWQYLDEDGTVLGQRNHPPRSRVGVYVPGGKAS